MEGWKGGSMEGWRGGGVEVSGNPRLVLVAGEASGDVYGADLARALRETFPEVTLYGVGGLRMQEAGVHLWKDSRYWGAIGVVEALRVAPRLLYILQQLKSLLKKHPPDLLIPIDFGAFNVPLCRWAKQQGIKVLYYMPPGSWRRDRQGSDLPYITDCIATPFPWSAEILNKMSANAHWVGHPLVHLVHPTEGREAFCERLSLDPKRPIIGLLPGSRLQEVYYLVQKFARTADLLHRARPGLQFVLSVMPHFDPERIEALWAQYSKLFIPLETSSAYNLMAHSDLLITCSGTATLEAALLGTPMLVVYQGSPWLYLEYRLRRKKLNISFISLPNLILDREVCPEFIQDEADPAVLCEHALRLLERGEEYLSQKESFRELPGLLGEGDTRWKVVALIAQLLSSQ